jgi:tetratricopeptide (TPR) repeat protein
MMFARAWRRLRSRRRVPVSIELFRRANRYRTEGRFERAAVLVAHGLRLDPDSVVGNLLAGQLHAIFRETAQARVAFDRVLARDPTQPRALFGRARVALEEGEPGTCREYLTRALARWGDFPEAQALLEVVREAGPKPGAAARAVSPLRLDRVRLPVEGRELLFARIDATLILAQPRGMRSDELAVRTAHLCRVAVALLARAGCGPLREALIEGAAERTYLRADDEVVLSLTFGRDVPVAEAAASVERVWANCRSELDSHVA